MTLTQNIHFWQLLPWLLSGFTFAVMYLAGNKDIRAWYVGLFAQALWIIFDIHLNQWGLMPIGVALVFMYARNIWVWSGTNITKAILCRFIGHVSDYPGGYMCERCGW